MPYLYTKDGKRVFIHHAIDVVSALDSENYFEENPVSVKAEKKSKRDAKKDDDEAPVENTGKNEESLSKYFEKVK